MSKCKGSNTSFHAVSFQGLDQGPNPVFERWAKGIDVDMIPYKCCYCDKWIPTHKLEYMKSGNFWAMEEH